MSNLLSIWESMRPHLVDNLVYLCIAVVSLIGLVKCLLPLWATTAAMRRAVKRLRVHDEIHAVKRLVLRNSEKRDVA